MTTAYGFVDLQHLFNRRVAEIGVERVWTAVQETAAEHTRVINGLMAAWVARTTMAQMQFEIPTGGTLQPLDENGIPLPVKPGGSYQVAFPIFGGGTASGANRVASAMMTVEEANQNTIDAQTRDANWLIRYLLAGILDDTAWTFTDKAQGTYKGLGDITIQPLANGDTVVYPRIGAVAPAVDDHYLAQAAAIDDSNNPFPLIHTELTEHPSQAGSEVIVYVPTNLKTTIKALANFIEDPDPNVIYGANNDRLARTISAGFGDRVLGYTDECWLVEWASLPSNYMIGHAAAAGPFMYMREYPAAELQGFFTERYSPDGARQEMRMIRYAGFGAVNRIGACVYQIGNATYQIPSGYETPLNL